MSAERILFIVEGNNSEKELIKVLNNIFNLDIKFDVFPYNNQIHALINEVYNDLAADDSLELIGLLKEKTFGQARRKKLSRKYSAIYLIFDFEPQSNIFDLKALLLFQQMFNDPLDKGMLILNYPMIEAFKHMRKESNDFYQKTITSSQAKDYKQLVHRETSFQDMLHLSLDDYKFLIKEHIRKLNFLVMNAPTFPSRPHFFSFCSNQDIIIKQTEAYHSNALMVISTIFYYLFELKDEAFFNSFNF